MSWRLACRLASYGKYQEAAWKHLRSIGVHHVLLSVPEPAQITAVRQRLDAHQLKPLVMRGQADLGEQGSVHELAAQIEICAQMNTHYMFISPKHSGTSKDTAYDRLRQVGKIAERHGIIVVLETHPDLGTNAETHRDTMKHVDHPNVRVNFDTGNITYYNEGADVVTELTRIINYVATVELKDHAGQALTWDFPPLGQGKINFAGVLEVLKSHGYDGPITIEVEGIEGITWDEEQTKQAIADSVAFLRRLAQFD
jgi:sugar phosphate isomerase/epimerase